MLNAEKKLETLSLSLFLFFLFSIIFFCWQNDSISSKAFLYYPNIF